MLFIGWGSWPFTVQTYPGEAPGLQEANQTFGAQEGEASDFGTHRPMFCLPIMATRNAYVIVIN